MSDNNEFENNRPEEERTDRQPDSSESSQYRMSFQRDNQKVSDDITNNGSSEQNYRQYENDNYSYQNSNFVNNDGGNNKKPNRNMGPIWGIIAAVLVLALIGGALIAAAKLTGSDKNDTKETSVVTITKETEKSTDSSAASSETTVNESKENATAAESSAGAQTVITKADQISTTNSVTASMLDVSDIVTEVMPSIVAVTNTTIYSSSTNNYWNWYFNQSSSDDYKASGAGSGVIIAQTDDSIMIATNAHVVLPTDYSQYGLSANTSEYAVQFCDDESVVASLKGYDEETDLAILVVKLSDMKADTLAAIKIATVGNSSNIKVGNGVIAIGNALGYGQSVTVGYVSALNREVTIDKITRKLLQTDAAINPGNSGGGLFDTNGRLIGINSAKYSSTSVEGIGFAIPMNEAETVLEKIMNTETVERVKVTDEDKMSYLGISASKQYSSAYEGQGAFVGDVVENGPAANAGIMAYDIITEINGVAITSWTELQNELAYYEGGTTVTVKYYTLQEAGGRRKYVEQTTDVTLGFKKDYTDSSSTKEN